MKKTIVSVCARGGSKGLPGKNTRLLAGKPLIMHTLEQAIAIAGQACVYVSTDDEAIADIARQAGVNVPFIRPAVLAHDEAGKIPVLWHLEDWLVQQKIDYDVWVDLDPTSPLRLQSDILQAMALLDDETDIVITGYLAEKNPYFNMVEEKADGNIGLVKTDSHAVVARQGAPDVYAMNGSVYVWHKHSLRKGLWDGRVKLYPMPRERSIDVDCLLDFKLVELIKAQQQEAVV